jgi:hypothetical protein
LKGVRWPTVLQLRKSPLDIAVVHARLQCWWKAYFRGRNRRTARKPKNFWYRYGELTDVGRCAAILDGRPETSWALVTNARRSTCRAFVMRGIDASPRERHPGMEWARFALSSDRSRRGHRRTESRVHRNRRGRGKDRRARRCGLRRENSPCTQPRLFGLTSPQGRIR